MDGGLEIASGRRHVANGQSYLSAREDGAGRERLALEECRHARELVGCRARPGDVPSGDLNLHLRREERRPTEVRIGRQLLRWNVQRIIQGFSNQGCRERHVTLGQTHQRKARLRIPPRLVRRQERLFRAADISGVQANSTEFGQRPSEFSSQVRAQFLTSAERFLLGLKTGPTQPEDLRAMHAAASVDTSHGLTLAPPFHGLRPLLGKVVLRDRLKSTDHLAVDHARGERIEFTGHRRDRRFVEEIQSARDLALQDEAARLRNPAERRGRRIAARAHVDGSTGPLPSASEIAGQQPFVAPHHRDPRMNRRVLLPREESLRPTRPSANRGQEGCVKQQMEGDAHGRAGRHEMVARPQPLCVHPLPRIDRGVDMTGGVCAVGEHGEIRRLQRLTRVRLNEQLIGLSPVAVRGSAMRTFQERGLGHLMHCRLRGCERQ